MKRWVVLLLFLVAVVAGVTGFSNDDTNDDKRLDAFLSKVEKFYKSKEQHSTNWNMPNRNPESTDYNMPTGNIGAVDNETGLVYDRSNGKLLDPDLNIELDTVTGMIYDFKTKKEYSLDELRSQTRKQL